jgi:hypothetical protein
MLVAVLAAVIFFARIGSTAPAGTDANVTVDESPASWATTEPAPPTYTPRVTTANSESPGVIANALDAGAWVATSDWEKLFAAGMRVVYQ